MDECGPWLAKGPVDCARRPVDNHHAAAKRAVSRWFAHLASNCGGHSSRRLPASAGPACQRRRQHRTRGRRPNRDHARQPSQFIPEALDAQILKPGSKSIGTGSFMSVGAAKCLGSSRQSRTTCSHPPFNALRSKATPACARFGPKCSRQHRHGLRGRARRARFASDREDDQRLSFTRHYQYVVIFNSKTPALRAPAVRRALNAAIGRAGARSGCHDRSTACHRPARFGRIIGPQSGLPAFTFDPKEAARFAAASGKPPLHRMERPGCGSPAW